MKLAKLLARLPEEGAEAFWREKGAGGAWRVEEGEGASAPEKCAELLASSSYLERELNRMKPWAAQIVKQLVRSFGPLPFDREAAERAALAEGISGAHVKAALLLFHKKGILFAIRKSWGEELYLFPEEAHPVWLSLLFPGALKECSPADLASGETMGNEGAAAYDVLLLMHQAASGELNLTKQGALTKAAVKKLAEGLMVQDEDLEETGIAARAPHQYGPAVESVLHMALQSGFLTEKDSALYPCRGKWDTWLQGSLGNAQRDLFQHWLEAVRTRMVWELHALAVIQNACPDRWFRVDLLFDWLRVCGMINRIDSEEKLRFIRSRLLPMQAFGWLRLNRLPEDWAFMLPHALTAGMDAPVERYNGMIVQPDLEIVLPPYPPLPLLWDMMNWGEPVSRGVLSVYRLTKSSVKRAVERGREPEELTELLARSSMLPADDKVIRILREWLGNHRAVIQSGVTLVRISDPAVCSCLESDGRFREILEERLAEGIYSIREQGLPQLAGELERLGVAALRQHPKKSDSSDDAALPCLIPHIQDPAGQPVPLPVPAQSADADWRDIPPSWWKAVSRYHPSTEKELIRKAIERKAGVRLADGQTGLVPLSIRESAEGWAVEAMRGREKITVRPDEWQGLQFIAPGLND